MAMGFLRRAEEVIDILNSGRGCELKKDFSPRLLILQQLSFAQQQQQRQQLHLVYLRGDNNQRESCNLANPFPRHKPECKGPKLEKGFTRTTAYREAAK